jgi:hypothetical protein
MGDDNGRPRPPSVIYTEDNDPFDDPRWEL